MLFDLVSILIVSILVVLKSLGTTLLQWILNLKLQISHFRMFSKISCKFRDILFGNMGMIPKEVSVSQSETF